MSYAIVDSISMLTGEQETKVLWTPPQAHGAVLDLTLWAPTTNTSVSIYARGLGGEDDIPIMLDVGLDLDNTKTIKAIYIHALQSLVIKGANIGGFVNGCGFRAPDDYLVKQGKFYNARGVRIPGSNRVVVEIPDFGKHTFTVIDGAAYMTTKSESLTTEVILRYADVPVTASSTLRSELYGCFRMGKFTRNNYMPTVMGQSKYLVFETSDPDFEVFFQYLLRRDV